MSLARALRVNSKFTPAARELAAGKHDSQPGELGPAATWPAPAQGPHGGHGGSYYQQRN